VIVRVNDRGPYVENRALDLSYAAARYLGAEQEGVIPVEAVIMETAPAQQPSTQTVAKL
jgi:rare lipoprotein A